MALTQPTIRTFGRPRRRVDPAPIALGALLAAGVVVDATKVDEWAITHPGAVARALLAVALAVLFAVWAAIPTIEHQDGER